MATVSLPESDVAAIQETIEVFSRCLEAKAFDDWVTYWADDGTLMPPGHARVVGHSALVQYIQKNFGDLQSIELSEWNVFGEGRTAIVTNNVQLTATDKKPGDPMKQIIVLRKNSSDKWRLKTIMFNAGV